MTVPLSPTRPAGAPRPVTVGAGVDGHRPWGSWLTVAVPALIAYVPLLLTQPGVVGADTKTYLYLDPAKLLADAPYVWDSQIGLGTVTHQNIGYLFPMGPFYLLFDLLGVPDWLAQRLWLGSVMLAAALGVRYLLRTLRFAEGTADQVRSGGILVASLAYMLSPYLLDYSARISVILLPWAALPWLIALGARAVRHGGWWYPSAFALVVLAVGGINATALLLVGLGPVLWILHAVAVDREATWRQASAAVGRIAVLTLATSLWWIAGLWAEGKFGLPVIRYTETYRAVAGASNAPEVLRGLGYWFFYGNDKLGPWIEPSVDYTTSLPILTLSFALPVTSMVVATLVRWRYRAYFLGLIVVGALVAVGGHPWESPSLLGGLFQAFTRTNAGLSLRSTPRAVPLITLASAVFLGCAVSAIGRRVPARSAVAAGVGCLLVMANIPAMWNGTMVAENLRRPEQIPTYWQSAADYLDRQPHDTRVLEMPGIDFASYRWGNTVDPITPGLIDRPYVARELFQWGSAPSAALLNAWDRRFQEGVADTRAVAPIARTFAIGDLVLRADLQYERFRTARPRFVWQALQQAPGLGRPVAFTPPTNSQASAQQPLIDELELGRLSSLPDAPLVSAFPVADPLPIVRAQPAERPLIVAGDAEGLVDAAGAGIYDPNQAVFYSGSLQTTATGAATSAAARNGPQADPARFDRVYQQQADLLVTDSNRKRAQRWGGLRENTGYTERAGEQPRVYDPGDQRLDLFPGASDATHTVSEQRAPSDAQPQATVTATAYGNPITYTPDDRPTNAVDGDPMTAWRVGAIDDPVGERLVVDLDRPISIDHLDLTQPLTNVRNRWITGVRLHFDDGAPVDVTLGPASRAEPGQRIDVGSRTFRHVEIEITATDIGKRGRYDGISGVGFSEVNIPGVSTDEVIRPPTDLLERAGPSSIDHRLTLLMSRARSNPGEPVRNDEETRMVRRVELPTARDFRLDATARLSSYAPDDVIDRLVGRPDARQGGITATSSARLPGAIDQRASAAVDGDPHTAWTSIYENPQGHWLEYTVPEPLTFDHLDLDVVADGNHSVPTRLRIEADGQQAAVVDLPPVTDGPERGSTTHLTVPTPAITGTTFRFIVDGVRETKVKDWYTDRPISAPVSIAELGVAGLRAPAVPARFDTGCRDDLLVVNGTPYPLRVTGTTADASTRQALDVTPCGDGVVPLGAGPSTLRTGLGRQLGIDLDQIVLASQAGGRAAATTTAEPLASPSTPGVRVIDEGRVSYRLEAAATDRPFWLVVGQSWNPGWKATVAGQDLGPPETIDGYANGWLVDPAALGRAGQPLEITVEWTPQRVVWVALALSLLGTIACVALLFFARRRRRTGGQPIEEASRPFTPAFERPFPPGAAVGRVATVAAVAGLTAFVLVDTPTVAWQLALAVPLAAASYLAFRSLRGRSALGLTAAACFAAAGLFTVVQQARNRFPADFVWPQLFDRVHILGLLAVFLLAGEALRELVARGGSRRSRPDDASDRPVSGGPI